MNQDNTILPDSSQAATTPTWKKVVMPALGLALLLVIIFGVASLSGRTANIFSSAAVSLAEMFNPKEELAITTPNLGVVTAGEPMTITITHNKPQAGSYTLFYPCGQDGFYFEAPKANSARETVFCDTPYPFTPNNGTLTLIPMVVGNEQYVDVSGIVMSFIPQGAREASVRNEVAITVKNPQADSLATNAGDTSVNGAETNSDTETNTTEETSSETGDNSSVTASSEETTSSTSQESTPSYVTVERTGTRRPVSDPNGRPDLAMRVVAVGTISSTMNPAGTFTPSTNPSKGQVLAVKVLVTNLGTKTSETSEMQYTLPTTKGSPETATQSVMSLLPGDAVEFVVAYDATYTGAQSAFFFVDPFGRIVESSETNNVATVTFNVSS